MNSDQRKALLADLAHADQQIAEYEALAASHRDEPALQRIIEALAGEKVIKETIERMLGAK